MHALPLLDLPEPVLEAVLLQLPTACERARAAAVCKRLRRLCQESTALWRHLEYACLFPVHLESFLQFASWLQATDRGVRVLSLHLFAPLEMSPRSVPCWALPRAVAATGRTLLELDVHVAGPLPSLDIYQLLSPLGQLEKAWISTPAMKISYSLSSLQQLRKLSLQGALQDADGVGDRMLGELSELAQERPKCWVPPRLTKLGLGVHLVPETNLLTCVGAATWVQALSLHGRGLQGLWLGFLGSLTQLRELHLTSCQLAYLPSQLTALSMLRVLYLSSNGRLGYVPPDGWLPLAHLRQLAFLSVSDCRLHELPPAIVINLVSLQALYITGNSIKHLPPGPYLAQLQELCLDWQLLFSCHAVLAQHAARLSRLLVGGKHTSGEAATAGGEQIVGRLLASLAALPVLAEFVDVMSDLEGEEVATKKREGVRVTADVALCLLRLGQQFPGLEVNVMEGEGLGWSMDDVKELEGQG